MNRTLTLLVSFLFTTLAFGQTPSKPAPLEEAAKRMKVPPGFNVTLFAGEPDIVQPIAMCFDDRGRLWVIENLSYPEWSKDGTGKDKVIIFEDSKGEGKFDKRTVFLDNGSNLTGIEIGYGGVWLLSAPNLIFIPIKPEEDKPAGPPVVKLTGWSLEGKHNIVSNLIWGPDGWLYGCNGILSNSEVGTPSSLPQTRTKMNCGVWRYHPINESFEVVASGTTNPWGLDWNQEGQMFITNCVIKHLWHIVPGGHYERMFGQDLESYVYEPMPSIVDYIHWAGGDWTTSRGGKGDHSDFGGGHAHSGAMVYLGDNWPKEYRGKIFTCNIHGNRINCDKLTQSGSSYKGERQPDFLFANDEWFRGISLKYGPDGAVYVLDWCDTGECHNYKEVDRSNGRIYKIAYGKPKAHLEEVDLKNLKMRTVEQFDLQKMNSDELILLLLHKNEWFVRKALRILQERLHRPEGAKISQSILKLAQFQFGLGDTSQFGDDKQWEKVMEYLRKESPFDASDERMKLRYMWVLGTPPLPKQYLEDKSEHVRSWANRLLLETNPSSFAGDYHLKMITEEKSPFVRLQILSALRKPGVAKDWVLESFANREEDINDPFLPKMLWYAMAEKFSPVKLPTDYKPTFAKIASPSVREWLIRHLVVQTGIEDPDLNKLLANTAEEPFQLSLAAGFIKGLMGRRAVTRPDGWKIAFIRWLSSESPELRSKALKLGVIFDEPRAFETLKTIVNDRAKSLETRQDALDTLADAAKPGTLPFLLDLLKDKSLRGPAIRALASYKDESIPTWLMLYFPQYTLEEQRAVVQTLSSRVEYGRELLEGLEKKTIPKQLIGVLEIRQLQALKDKEIEARLKKIIGTINPPKANMKEEMQKYKSAYAPEVLAKADLKNGRLLFQKTCAVCHQLHGEGAKIGPDLTGSQRTKLDYLLENILDPSAIVAKEYRVKIALTKEGRVVTGIVKQETPDAVVMQNADATVTLSKKDLEEIKESKQSLMPDGLLTALSAAEIRDLFGYLMNKDKP